MLTPSRVQSLLSYDPLTGVFLWKHSTERNVQWNGRYPGTKAGCIGDGGYLLICIDKRLYRAHHLAWLLTYGTLPKLIDHVNGDRANNAISNLRLATQSQNCANSWRPHKSSTGLKGVSPSGRRNTPWGAYIKQNGKSQYLGRYKTPEEAHAAYVAKAKELFGEFARVG